MRQAAAAAEDLWYLGYQVKAAECLFHDYCNRAHGRNPFLRDPNRASCLYLVVSQIPLVVADNVNPP